VNPSCSSSRVLHLLHLSLQLFWRHHHASPPCSLIIVVLPSSRLASGHAASGQSSLRLDNVSLSLQLFRRPSTTTQAPLLLPPTLCCHRTVLPLATLLRPPSLHLFFLHLHFVHEHFPFFPQLSRCGSYKVNFQRIFVWFFVLYMLIFNFRYCEC